MYCYRKLLGVSWTQKVKNVEIRKRVNIRDDHLIKTIIRRKLGLFGHICRMEDSRLVKVVMFGEIAGKAKRGRPSREWLDDIIDWCGFDIHKLATEARDRNLWRSRIEQTLDTYGQ